MSYRIEYAREKKGKNHRLPKGTGFLAAIVIVALLAALEFTGLKERLWLQILPGDAQVTAAALDEFVADLRAGESTSEAITAFCQEIVNHAKIPE